MNKELIVVVGPTAIGKTQLAIDLAQHFDTSIISADSRQFYKEMTIGTAVPSKKELATVPHFCVQHKSIHDQYTVRDFEKEALLLVDQIFQKSNKAILVGGSGLYAKAVVEGLDDIPDIEPSIREELNKKLEINGLSSLVSQLQELDPAITTSIDLQNPRRVIRALEVVMSTGQSLLTFQKNQKEKRPFKVKTVGLTADRNKLYERIERRVDLMIANELVEEVEGLFEHQHLNALQTVGYREIFDFIKGAETLENAILKIKQNSRRFAKRQLTFFNNQMQVEWHDCNTPVEKIIETL
jgi:tRNA dimethylallyltransferase